MDLYKNILKTIVIVSCCFLLMACSNNNVVKDSYIIINGNNYEIQTQNKFNSIKDIKVEQNKNIVITLPREIPIYQWIDSPNIDGLELVEKSTTQIGQYDGKEGTTNIADVFIYKINEKNNYNLEFKKVNINDLDNYENKDYRNLKEVFKLNVKLYCE